MNEIKKYVIQARTQAELKTGVSKKDNKTPYDYYQGGLKINGEFYNGFFLKGNKETFDNIKTGDTVYLVLFNHEYQGNLYKRFRFPNKDEIVNMRLNDLEKDQQTIHKEIQQLAVTLTSSTFTRPYIKPENPTVKDESDLPF